MSGCTSDALVSFLFDGTNVLEKRNSSKDDKNTLMSRHEHFSPQKHTTFKILFVYQLYQKQGVSSSGCFQYNGWGFNKSHIKFFPKSRWRGTISWLTREALYGINYMCHSTQSCKSSLRVAHKRSVQCAGNLLSWCLGLLPATPPRRFCRDASCQSLHLLPESIRLHRNRFQNWKNIVTCMQTHHKPVDKEQLSMFRVSCHTFW